MAEDADTERMLARAREAGLDEALRLHRDDVLAAARSAAGFQARREPIQDMRAEPAHVFRVQPTQPVGGADVAPGEHPGERR